ncbi:hypothetical protein GGS23DRAFT_101186 [Durotheca rogersii]|uniref:uncharacterized protein n=1 Tax=Durotheca rogersii TaxID=419775 RepID=UPI00222063E0|nr:uncharacterized protein GGS23DRAFT_101186 [Durotheca rogersii]KAI5862456.1 hypothetical protein GGS23DRAFT_101186 [Durotheca rogersii]
MASNQSSTNPTALSDPLDLFDFSEYDAGTYSSPSLSPSAANKSQFVRTPTAVTATTPSTLPAGQVLSGPSHQYDQYKQQTPFVPGAVANTMAINRNNAQITGYDLEYAPYNFSQTDDVFNFSPQSLSTADMDLDFDPQAESSFLFPDQTINPNAIGAPDSQVVAGSLRQPGNAGRMYPGIHQQTAMERARQQQIVRGQNLKVKQPRPKPPADPIVEHKITQVLNHMRAQCASPSDGGDGSPVTQVPRAKKDEDDMDEDERLLASEEGKKLSSKERRQLRNKVSARAFRSRRKEYITQLEAEIANKVTENGELRSQNRALAEENRRLGDFTRMLLSSPSFSGFLDHLSANPAALPQSQLQPPQPEQRLSDARQRPKDVHAFATSQPAEQPHTIGMVMLPEQSMEWRSLNLGPDHFNYQPQVFTILETLDLPAVDTEALAGKSTNFVGELVASGIEKTEAPVLVSPVLPLADAAATPDEPTSSESPASDLDGDIYEEPETASSKPADLNTDSLIAVDIFGDVEPEKAFARYELVESEGEDIVTSIAARRVDRLMASIEPLLARLERLTVGL